ncbi:hypothetical protein P3T76_011742 [Phytophthora citrophthora]|uniref:Uncharacterized protein n=1 Tax=Phytophthora citrophthora TaxID=4793 RepID=A0AAD9LFS5_9STRA|nr:hypothetical protein P3T76_011742 [Phytophthora citrophthora]
MSNMTASGLGVDSSSSMTFPFPTGAGYCRTDEEEEGEEYEVDNCFDYTPEEEDLEMQQTNKVMAAVTNTTSTTTIQQQTSVTLVLGQDINGEVEEKKEVSLGEEEKQIPGSPALIAAEKTKDTVPARLNSSIATPRDDPVCEMDKPSVGEEIASETPPGGETHNERAEEATKYLEEATQVPASKSESQGPTPSALMPAVAIPDTSPKPTQVKTPVTPKKPKRSASKKRKTPPKRNKSGVNRSAKSRRSSQIQHEAPSATCAVPQLADGTEILTHFINLPSSISCNHCGKEMKDSRGNATRHLKSSPVLRTQQLTDAQKEEVVQKDVELPVPVLNRVNTSSGITLVQLMGTEDLAAKVQGAFASTPFAGDAPISRLDPIVKNDVTGLRHLVVVDLLDAVDPLDGPVLQLQTVTPGVEYCTGHDQPASLSKAKARVLEGNCLRFPAPRTVAEQFISPLAKELGLEYAMNQHTANLVSCPRVGIGLDWRFRQTETVVFLLRGEVTWKLIKGEVDYPLGNFEPETWIQEEMDQLAAKVYGLTAGRTGTEGFLLPPRAD